MLRLTFGARFCGRGLRLGMSLLPVVLLPGLLSPVAGMAATHPAAHSVPARKAKAEPVAAHTAGSRRGEKAAEPAAAKRVRGGRGADELVRAKAPAAKSGRGTSRHLSAAEDEPAARNGKVGISRSGKAAPAATKGRNAHGKPEDAESRPDRSSRTSGKHRRPAAEPDYDPPVMNRAGLTRSGRDARTGPASRTRTVQASAPRESAPRESAPREVAVRSAHGEDEAPATVPTGGIGTAFPDGEVTGHHDRRPGPASLANRHGGNPAAAPASAPAGVAASALAERGQATNEDFLRAAGIARTPAPASAALPAAQAEVLARGESHPDDDVRVDMTLPPRPARNQPATAPARRPQAAVTALPAALSPSAAIVTATPAPAATVGSTVTAGLLHKKARVDILPEDLAGKDAVIADAMRPMVLPALYGPDGRLVVPPPMRGSREILVHQNTMADSDGLKRIQDDDDLNRMRAAHLLVPIVDSDALEVNSDLPENRRAARPWTVQFVEDISRAYYAHFHQPLRLSSAVRTVAYQLRLQRVNGNAAAVDGDGASPHLTGQAIDFGKHGMSVAEVAWMRAALKPLVDAGKIDVEEEFQQACFHISVYRVYAPAAPATKKPRTMEVAQVRSTPAPIVRRSPSAVTDRQVDNSVIEASLPAAPAAVPVLAATEAATPDQR